MEPNSKVKPPSDKEVLVLHEWMRRGFPLNVDIDPWHEWIGKEYVRGVQSPARTAPYPVDPLLPNSRTQMFKLLMNPPAPRQPWWYSLWRALVVTRRQG